MGKMTIPPLGVLQGGLNTSTYDQELAFCLASGKGLGNIYAQLLKEPICGHDENMTGKR